MAGETSAVTAVPLGYACSVSVWPGPGTGETGKTDEAKRPGLCLPSVNLA